MRINNITWKLCPDAKQCLASTDITSPPEKDASNSQISYDTSVVTDELGEIDYKYYARKARKLRSNAFFSLFKR